MKMKKSSDFDDSRYFFPKLTVTAYYFIAPTNHDKDVRTNHEKIVTNMKLTVTGNDRLTPDSKEHS